MANNETISNNTLDLGFVIYRKSKDFSLVPTKPYYMLFAEGMLDVGDENEFLSIEDITPYENFDILCEVDFWPDNGYFFFIDNTSISSFVLNNLELIYDIGFRILKIDGDIALVINAYGLSYDTFYFLPLYKLLVSNGVVHL